MATDFNNIIIIGRLTADPVEKFLPSGDAISEFSIANSMENYGNFFGQNLFLASPGILLAISTLSEIGIENLEGSSFAIASIPMAITAFIVSVIRNYLLDLKVKRLIKYLQK